MFKTTIPFEDTEPLSVRPPVLGYPAISALLTSIGIFTLIVLQPLKGLGLSVLEAFLIYAIVGLAAIAGNPGYRMEASLQEAIAAISLGGVLGSLLQLIHWWLV